MTITWCFNASLCSSRLHDQQPRVHEKEIASIHYYHPWFPNNTGEITGYFYCPFFKGADFIPSKVTNKKNLTPEAHFGVLWVQVICSP